MYIPVKEWEVFVINSIIHLSKGLHPSRDNIVSGPNNEDEMSGVWRRPST